mmetsp:Transcript_27699/g.64177  ORF Transcript_27699/g.64177 Transcript_27699/m.64177 type:complete len:86 (-) Transcript_27699:313-570(-)
MTKKNETAKVLPERSESAEYFEGGDEYDDFDDFQLGQQHGGGGGGGGSRAAKAEKKKTGGSGTVYSAKHTRLREAQHHQHQGGKS